ncbi:MAG: alpha-glucan family phosphorylase, partial [Dehalococcoidia bacterium]|nr:alpha-glucan family phosphorylase [Dehalococcoidia bacterium]
PLRRLYDLHIPEWRRDNLYLRYAISIPLEEIQKAHAQAKQQLLSEVERRAGVQLDPAIMTIGFARRATAYKRADLLVSDVERLRRISRDVGRLQVIYGGKAHPRDEGGKAMMRHISQVADVLKGEVPIVYLEEYDMSLGRLMCGGTDLWLNTPERPREASGTSGMKAALNGVPSLSVLDGWWLEGHFEGVTGWSIGNGEISESDPSKEAASLYAKLENIIVPLFIHDPMGYARVMRSTIATNGSFFNAQRVIFQYLRNAYMLDENSMSA